MNSPKLFAQLQQPDTKPPLLSTLKKKKNTAKHCPELKKKKKKHGTPGCEGSTGELHVCEEQGETTMADRLQL